MTDPDIWAAQYDSIWEANSFGAAGFGPHSTLSLPGSPGYMDAMVAYLVPPELLRLAEIKGTTNVAELASGMFDPLREDFMWCLDINCQLSYTLTQTDIAHIYEVMLNGGEITDDDFCRLVRGLGTTSFRKRTWLRIKSFFGIGEVETQNACINSCTASFCWLGFISPQFAINFGARFKISFSISRFVARSFVA